MKIVKNAHKAWSTWGIAAIGLFEGFRQVWPILESQLPAPIYDYGLFTLAGAALALRFIDQGLSNDK